MDHWDLGSAPYDEDCAQLGVDPEYPEKARRECRALINQLRRKCGDPPPGARLRIVENDHDFGVYYSVVVDFDAADEDALAYAMFCEEADLAEWDEFARLELGLAAPTDRTTESAVRP